MTVRALLAAALVAAAPAGAATYTNPILYADYSDPDVCRVGDDFYLTASSFDAIPGLPILPGVVQVDWAIRFAEEYLGIPTGRFTGMKALKFSAPIQPDLRLTLELRWRPDTHRLEFTYLSQSQKYSSGQMLFSGAPA